MSSPDVTVLTRFLREPVSLLLSHSCESRREKIVLRLKVRWGHRGKLFLNPHEYELWHLGSKFDRVLGLTSALKIRESKRSIVRLDRFFRDPHFLVRGRLSNDTLGNSHLPPLGVS